ncbi:MAG: hypothetical protein II920_00520, partial [Clostridia bacterium]|nr:hypothetical protein [Clostridia bacterium]
MERVYINGVFRAFAAFMLAFAMLFSYAQAQVSLSAQANPDAYYTDFESSVLLTVLNTEDSEITLVSLNVADKDIDIRPVKLASGQVFTTEAPVSVTAKMLDTGHFYVTLKYESTDAGGQTVSAVTQIMCYVKRINDEAQVQLHFALPDRPLPEDASQTEVSYILENTGAIDIEQAVIICYPEGYLSEPQTVKAGEYIVVRRMVSMSDLENISAEVTCRSAYYGTEYHFSGNYEGNLADTAVVLVVSEKASAEPQAAEPADMQYSENAPYTAPAITAAQSGKGLSISVTAGSETLTDVKITDNGTETIRKLAILGVGQTAIINYLPSTDGTHVFSLTALLPDGQTVICESKEIDFEA